MSDLHLESSADPDAFDPPRPDFDILVAAGDIMEGDPERAIAIVARLAVGKPAIFVIGNHECWFTTPERCRERASDAAKKHRVNLLDRSAVVVEGVRFVGGTLWTDGELSALNRLPGWKTGEGILQPDGRSGIRFRDEISLHQSHRHCIQSLLAVERPVGQALVVVTHHAPLLESLPEPLRQKPNVGLYASDLSELMWGNPIDLWIHGHVHAPSDYRHASGTRVVANPAGTRFSTPGFQPGLVISV